jgi:hypothetical protein
MAGSPTTISRRPKVVASVVLIAILCVVIWANQWKSNQQVGKLIVQGNVFVPVNEIVQAANISAAGTRLGEVDLHEIEQRVLTIPFVKSVVASFSTDNQIIIAIKERTPICYTIRPSGTLAYIDDECTELSFRFAEHMPDLPLLRVQHMQVEKDTVPSMDKEMQLAMKGTFLDDYDGKEVSIKETEQLYYSADEQERLSLEYGISILKELRKSNARDISRKSVYRSVSEVWIDKQGNATLLVTKRPVSVLIGQQYQLQDKLERFTAFFQKNVIQSERNVSRVDVRWNGLILTSNS